MRWVLLLTVLPWAQTWAGVGLGGWQKGWACLLAFGVILVGWPELRDSFLAIRVRPRSRQAIPAWGILFLVGVALARLAGGRALPDVFLKWTPSVEATGGVLSAWVSARLLWTMKKPSSL